MKSQLRRKDLKRPDEFVTYGQQLIAWVQSHRRGVGLSLLIVLATLAAVGGVSMYRRSALERANTALAAALAAYREQKYAEAARAFKSVAEEWSDADIGRLAAVLSAQAALRAGETSHLLDELEPLLRSAKLPSVLSQQAWLTAGYAHLSAGRHAEAVNSFARAAEIGGPYSVVARYEQLLQAVRAGDESQARALLKMLEEHHADAPETRRARTLLRES